MEIRILNRENIQQVLSMKETIEADKEALKIYSDKQSDIPLRANLDIPEYDGQSLYMYGYVAPAKASGVKIVSVYPHNIERGLTSVPATMVTLNSETGEVNCLMDGTYLTQLRTGAVAGAATDELARKDASIFALFGTGGQAETQLEAVLNVRPIKEVKVFDLSKERRENFANKMQKKFGNIFEVNIRAVNSSDEAVKDADIITTVTTAKEAVFDGTLVKPGAHINGVGSYTPEMAEIPESLIIKADKIYVDTWDGAVKESGDLIQPLEKGILQENQMTGEIGDQIAGRIKGRESEEEITFFETTGSAVLDLVVAQKIYEAAAEKGIGQIISL